MGRSYQLLTELKNPVIDRCQQILPNQLQCWKPGDIVVTESEEVTADGAEGGVATTTKTYQLCRAHAVIQQRADQLASAATSENPIPSTDSQNEALKQEALNQQTSMPSGEESPNN